LFRLIRFSRHSYFVIQEHKGCQIKAAKNRFSGKHLGRLKPPNIRGCVQSDHKLAFPGDGVASWGSCTAVLVVSPSAAGALMLVRGRHAGQGQQCTGLSGCEEEWHDLPEVWPLQGCVLRSAIPKRTPPLFP
jgi:hypothetical protein